VDYQYETGDALTRQQSDSHSRGRGILRNHRGDARSDDSSSSSLPRSRDSSVDSLPQPSDWAISDHKVPLTGGGEGGRSGRAPRRGSLNSSLEGSANFRFKMKSGVHNPFNNPFIDIPAPKKPQKTQKTQKTSRRKANRRSSLGEASSNNDSFSNSQRSFNGSLRSLGAKFQRRGSMGDDTTTHTGGDNDASTTSMNYRPKGKMARRSSMGDTPSSYSHQPQPPPTPQPLPQQQIQPLTQPAHTRMGRRNSLTHVSASATPSNAKPKGILRRSSLDFGEASSDDGSMLYSMPPKMARRGSMNDVVTTIEPSMPLKSAMKMSRRGSMNDVVSTIPSETSMPLKSSMKMSRRGSMNDVVTTIEPSMPLKSAMKMSRRGSMNDVVSTIPTSTIDSSMPLKSSMKMARRGSLNDATTTTTTKATPAMEPSQNEAWQMPPRSILRRGSLSDVATEPSSSDLPYRVVPTKMGRGAPLNDSPNTPLNDSSSMMSYRLSSMNSRKSNFSDGPKSSLKAPKTGSASYRSSRTTSLNDISGPPLSDGLMGMGGGYCVPLKSMSERNNRTIKGKEVDQSPLSTSERSISNSRRSFRSSRTSSTYYTDRSTQGSSQSAGSISSIPIDVVDGYHDSIVSHLGGRGVSTRANRSSYGYGSDDSSVNTFDTDDQSITQQLDEMESSTRSGGINSFEDSWSINNLAADQSQSDHNAATTLFQNRSQRTRPSIKIPQASLDDSSSSDETGNRDESMKLMRMEGDNWDDEDMQASFHLEDDVLGPAPGRRRSMQLNEVRPSKRISSLEFDGESLGLGQSTKSITWEDESLGASNGQLYGASYGASLSGGPRQSRQSSLTWDETSIGLQSSKKSLTWEDDSLAPPNLARRSSLELEDGSEDDLNYIYGYEPAEPDIREDSDSSLGDFAESTVSRSLVSRSKQDSDGSLGDFAATVSKQDSDSSLGDFAAAAANQDSDGSLGDFAEAALSRSPARSKQGSDGSLGDFAAPAPSRSQRSSFSQFKQGSDRSLGDFAGSGSDSDDDSLSEESDGLIRDDEIFQNALSHMVESTTPTAFKRNTSRRGSVGDYTLSLSGKGDVPDIDRSEKSITFGRRRSLSSAPQSALDGSIRSRDITTISEDSFEITADELGIYNPSDGKDLYPQQLALMREGDEDVGSFMSCSSEYDSSTFYDSDEEKEKRVKEGLMWGLGTMGVGALVGWLVKLFRKGSGEDEMDVIDLETIHDELGQSIAQSVLDESVNFTGSEQLWGWASLGDGGASAELVVSALHLPGTETAIISAATGAAAPTTSTAAGAAAVAATTNTMAVTAAGNVGAIAVTTTAVIGNSAIATGAGVGISGAVSGAGAAASGVMAAMGLSGTGGSAAAVMGSAMGALAVAGTTYYSAAGHNVTAGDIWNFSSEVCPHLNPDNQTGVFRLTLDVSGMQGTEESWGWMPFSDGVGDNSTSSDVLKEVWEELFASAYNNITNGGCSEQFERRVLDANLTSSIHTGSSDGEAFLETEWEVSVACWEECPIEPIFGTELRRQLEPTGLQTFDTNTTLDANAIQYTNTTIDTNTTLVDDTSKFFISELEFRSFFEIEIHNAAGWGKTVNKIDFGNGNFVAIPNLIQDSNSDTSSDSASESPTMSPTETPTVSPTESPIIT